MYLIEKWLSGPRNFYVGKSIYKSLGSDQRLKDLLDKGSTPIAEELLLKALQSLITKPAVVHIQKATIETEEMPVASDPILESIRKEWMKPYQEMNYKRHQLDQYKGDAADMVVKRKILAFEILDLEQECMKAWKKRDHYLQHGSLPDVSEKKMELPADPVELARLIDSIKKNIRRNRLQMEKQPDKPLYAQKHREYKQRYEEITGVAYDEKEENKK